MQGDSLQRAAAEFVGAFTLIFVGVGAIAATAGGDLVAIAFAHGLAIAVMVSAVGHISGGHFNPAVTLGFLVTGRISTAHAILYWIAQIAGAVVAALAITWLLPNALTDPVALGIPALGDGVGATQGAVIEGILTFFLVWVVFATAADPRGTFASIAGLAIGLTITLDILMGGGLHRRRDEPGARVRPRARRGRLDERLGLVRRPAHRRGGRCGRLPVAVSRAAPSAGAAARAREGLEAERSFEHAAGLGETGLGDRVADRILAVGHVEPGSREPVARVTAEADVDDGIGRPVRDRDGKPRARLGIQGEPVHGRDEPAERQDRGRGTAAWRRARARTT